MTNATAALASGLTLLKIKVKCQNLVSKLGFRPMSYKEKKLGGKGLEKNPAQSLVLPKDNTHAQRTVLEVTWNIY